jgi:GT2 family glycosyltransferase
MYERLLAGTSFEIVPIHDATSLAEGYNRGLKLGQGDPVIFSHDDVLFLAPDFYSKLMGHMASCDVLGVAGTRLLTGPGWIHAGLTYAYGQIAYPNYANSGQFGLVIWSVPRRRLDRTQALDGVFLCARRSVATVLGFDEQTFKRFYLYDMDFTYRAFLEGYRLSVACDLYPLHDSEGRDDDLWEEDRRLFAGKFAGRLAKSPAVVLSYQNAAMLVPTAQDVVRLMTPSHWDE